MISNIKKLSSSMTINTETKISSNELNSLNNLPCFKSSNFSIGKSAFYLQSILSQEQLQIDREKTCELVSNLKEYNVCYNGVTVNFEGNRISVGISNGRKGSMIHKWYMTYMFTYTATQVRTIFMGTSVGGWEGWS